MTTSPRDEFLHELGTRVRMLREDHGWSQYELADRSDLDRTFLGFLERGVRGVNVARLPDLAGALRVQPYALVPGWPAGPEPLLPGPVAEPYAQWRLRDLVTDLDRRTGPPA